MMNEEEDIPEDEEEQSGMLFLEWVVTASLAGVFVYLIIKFLFF